jgi:hypothetical protein
MIISDSHIRRPGRRVYNVTPPPAGSYDGIYQFVRIPDSDVGVTPKARLARRPQARRSDRPRRRPRRGRAGPWHRRRHGPARGPSHGDRADDPSNDEPDRAAAAGSGYPSQLEA